MNSLKINTNVISKVEDIYNLDLNVVRKFEDRYIAKNEDKPFELYMLSKKVMDVLILDYSASLRDCFEQEDYDTALEFATTLNEFCELKAGKITKVVLW